MSNMSYCRFRNTLSDLRDCYDHINDLSLAESNPVDDDDLERTLSEDEADARDALIKLCKRIARDYATEDDDE